jgi:hypothetical protein
MKFINYAFYPSFVSGTLEPEMAPATQARVRIRIRNSKFGIEIDKFAHSECSELGGTAEGNCAMGFGTCCVFTKSVCASTVSQNNTYIQ